ncbi:MAG: hypothetical protein RBG13Loki_1776 [Promethearchaeota archaeon CR_4]|nr:MAG: hypothetical protein RBG13Loki_1776 [Candidatus Lokiarchaeota archaeon CR_4]
MESSSPNLLIAPCGMNCSICGAYLRARNKCPGCRADKVHKPVTIAQCKIKNCYKFRFKKAKFCFECEKIPCDKLKHLDTRYRTKYHMSMVENLKFIQEQGMQKFLQNEKIRWTCRKCGETICVHKKCCFSCGAELEHQILKEKVD